MGFLIEGTVDAQQLMLAAASSAAAATMDMVEIAREGVDHAGGLLNRETSENLADALQSALSIELDALPTGERKEAVGQLLAACSRFLEGWA